MPLKDETVSATARMEAARRSTRRLLDQNLALVGILARLWAGSHRCRLVNGEQAVCLHSPAGPLVWRLLDNEEPAIFEHLPESAVDAPDPRGIAKLGILLDLAINGW